MVQKSPNFDLVTRPSLALLVFRLVLSDTPKASDAELNLLNQRLSDRLHEKGDVFLTQTMLHSSDREIFCIRLALGSVNTTMRDVEEVWGAVEEEGARVLKAWNNV